MSGIPDMSAFRGIQDEKTKHEITLKLTGREWFQLLIAIKSNHHEADQKAEVIGAWAKTSNAPASALEEFEKMRVASHDAYMKVLETAECVLGEGSIMKLIKAFNDADDYVQSKMKEIL